MSALLRADCRPCSGRWFRALPTPVILDASHWLPLDGIRIRTSQLSCVLCQLSYKEMVVDELALTHGCWSCVPKTIPPAVYVHHRLGGGRRFRTADLLVMSQSLYS